MNTKLSLTALLSFSFYFLSSQVPQGFNYQAIARDGSGNPISTAIDVKIAILTSADDASLIWEELHTGVDPDDHGLFSIVVGKGVTQAGGLSSFSLIDWTETPLFIRTKINDVKLGTAQLWSVPYAMVADSLGGPLSKLKVKGSAGSTLDEALFEVKNKTGQTVFAVYNEGVRIYVDDGDAKGAKGGFSVGGFGSDKAGESQPLLVVNPDSIRAYVYDDPLAKSPKGGFAVGGFDALKGATNEYLMVSPDSVRIYIDKAPDSKAPKGGFSVGGFDQAKGPDEEYLRVTRDSTRIYVNEDASKASKGGFSIGGFGTGKSNVTSFTSLTPENYFIGHEAGSKISSGTLNSFIGYQSGKSTTTGNSNTFMGYQSGFGNKTGIGNLYIGYQAGYSATTGNGSQYIGYMSGYSNTTGTVNTFVGTFSGLMNTKGSYNTYVGNNTGGMDSLGKYNAFYGFETGSMSQGSWNTYIGSKSGNENENGNYNAFLGTYSGDRSTGSNNVFLGYNSGTTSDATGSVYLGYNAGGNFDRSSSLLIANSNTSPYESNALVYGEFDNKLFRINGQLLLPYRSGNSVLTMTTGNGNNVFFKSEADLLRIQSDYTGNPTLLWLDKYGQAGIGSSLSVPASLYAAYNSGYVGIGTNSPSFVLHVLKSSSNGTWLSTFQNGTSSVQLAYGGGAGIYVNTNNTSSSLYGLDVYNGTSHVLYVRNDGFVGIGNSAPGVKFDITAGYGRVQTGYSWLTNSDIRYKKNISDLENALEMITSLRGVRFDLIDDENIISGKGKYIGFIAQELEKVFPEFVVTEENSYKSVAYDKIGVVLVEAMKDQQKIIESQTAKISEQESQIESLKTRLDKIEALLAGNGE